MFEISKFRNIGLSTYDCSKCSPFRQISGLGNYCYPKIRPQWHAIFYESKSMMFSQMEHKLLNN